MMANRLWLTTNCVAAIVLIASVNANNDYLTSTEHQDLPACQVVGNEYERTLLLQKGMTEDIMEVSVFIEETSPAASLRVTERSSNPLTLTGDGTDTVVSQMISEQVIGGTLYNFTVEFEFDKCPGKVFYDLRVYNGESLHCQIDMDFIVAGVCVTTTDTQGGTVFLTGRPKEESATWDYIELTNNLERTFDAYIVFPDGSDSNKPLSGHDLSHMEINPLAYREQVKYNFNVGECDIGAGKYVGDAVSLPDEECQLGFSENDVDGSWLGIFFGMNFQPYRTGDFGFEIVWPEFTENSYFDEVFETSFYMRITGDPPPAVSSVSPRGPFRPEGGEEISVTVYNIETFTDIEFVVTGADEAFPMVPGSFKEIGNFTYEVSFTTKPGVGTNLPYYLSVTRQDGTVVDSVHVGEIPFDFDYYTRPVIDSMTPTSGTELGGTVVTLSGTFADFDVTRGDGVYFNNQRIDESSDESLVLSTSSSEIVFKTPAKPGQSFEVDVTVVIDGLQSNSVLFTYLGETLVVRIVSSGPSLTDDGSYVLGSCSDSTYTAVPSVTGDISYVYKWSVVSTGGTVIAEPEGNSFSLAERDLMDGQVYVISVVVRGAQTGVEGEASIQVVKVDDIRLGVSIGKPVPRSRSVPFSPLRVYADVRLPSCYEGSTEIEYQWTYKGVAIKMSYANETAGDITKFSPTKLGREFVIDQSELVAGASTEISVKAIILSDEAVFGAASETIDIFASDLIPLIGDGESSITRDVTTPFIMTCGNSFDPDVLDASQNTASLTHEWLCRRAGKEDLSDSVDCEIELLPSNPGASFEVTYSTAGMYVEYTCKVSSADGRTATTSQLVQTVGEPLPSFSVKAVNTRLELVDLDSVPPYEALVLMPVLEAGTSVSYKVVSPAYEKFTLLSPDNMLPPPAYWQPGDVSSSALPLGLQPSAMKPNTVYEIECEYSSSITGSSAKSLIKLTTLEKPRLVLLPMAKTTGAPYEIFSVQALSTIESASFGFRFYLKYDGDETEFCVGCDGLSVIEFVITQPGRYTLRAELWDSLGKDMMDSLDGPTLVVEEAQGRQEATMNTGQLSSYLNTLYTTGDHNGFLRSVFQLVHQYALINKESDVIDRSLLKGSMARVLAIAGKSVPSSADGASIATTCSSLLALDSQWFEEFSQIYELIGCLQAVKDKTPPAEKLDIQDATLRAFEHGLGHAYGATTDGTTRERLLLPAADELNAPLLTIAEAVSQMVVDVSVRDEYCGYESMKSQRVSSIGTFDFGFKTVCNSDSTLQITVDEDTFTWCNAALSDDGSRRMFSAVKAADFVSLSRVQGAKASDTQSLLMTSVMSYENGKAVHLFPEVRDCYTMSLRMNSVQDVSLDSAAGFLFGDRAKTLDSNVTQGTSYTRMTVDAGVTASVLSQAGFATFTTRIPGLAGALYTSAPTASASDDQSAISGSGLALSNIFGIASGLLVFIIIAVLVAWVVATRCLLIAAAPPPPLEADETYVERDVYGRSVWAEDYGQTTEVADDNGMM